MTDTAVVYIVDDDSASREAVESLVNEMNVKVVSYGSAEEFLKNYQGHRPACLVTDVRMIQMSGLELQEELARRGHRLATVVLTAYAETKVTVRAMRNGAVTLLEKPCRDLELWDAIRGAIAEDTEKYERDLNEAEAVRRLAQLTPSESEVLGMIVAGAPNKEIAKHMDVSVRTIEVRRQSVFAKAGVGSVAELVRLAVDAGI